MTFSMALALDNHEFRDCGVRLFVGDWQKSVKKHIFS